MLNGVLAAFGIMVLALVIPIVHFVSAPIAPFIAGFFGGGLAKADEGKVITFGLIVAGLMLIPVAALIAIVLLVDGDPLGLPDWLIWAAAIILVPYTWFGVTLGALLSYMLRQKDAKQAAAKEPSKPSRTPSRQQ